MLVLRIKLNLREPSKPVEIRIVDADVIKAAMAVTGFTREQIVQYKRRSRHLVNARKMIVALLRQQGLPLTVIAREVGYRDHTSVLYHLKQHQSHMQTEPAYRKQFQTIINHLNNQ